MKNSEIVKLYEDGMSVGELSKKFHTYNMKIYRILKNEGVHIRSRSEAQKLNLDTGKIEHPTLGKPRSEKIKDKISKSQFDKWVNTSDDKKALRSKEAKERWDNKSKKEREDFQKKSQEQRMKTCKEGSKLEKLLCKSLSLYGYTVIPHRKKFLPNVKLETDLLIPEIQTVIEIDGPTHFRPIWGEEKLEQVKKSDQEKNGLLLNSGYIVIRIHCVFNHIRRAHEKQILDKLLPLLDGFRKQFPPIHNRLHILEFIFKDT